MPIKNFKELLVDIAKLPASIETSLPNGIPRLSSTLVNAAASMPTMPDFPMAIPDIPSMPAFSIPGMGNSGNSGKTPEVEKKPATRRAPAFNFA